jgi:phosphatidylserine/phosphatidylglycerophosphate/cardiolipin synthase-like enzyme
VPPRQPAICKSAGPALVDDVTLETGSYNYTAAAERSNAENCLVIRRAAALVKSYSTDWVLHAKHATR